MPQQTDLILNDNAAVARTFVATSPGSFGSPAEWVYKAGVVSTVFPRITALATKTSNQSNKLSTRLKIPSSYVDAATGLTKAGTAWEVNLTVSVPDAFPEALRADAVAFTKNMVNHSLIQAMMRDGLPAT